MGPAARPVSNDSTTERCLQRALALPKGRPVKPLEECARRALLIPHRRLAMVTGAEAAPLCGQKPEWNTGHQDMRAA